MERVIQPRFGDERRVKTMAEWRARRPRFRSRWDGRRGAGAGATTGQEGIRTAGAKEATDCEMDLAMEDEDAEDDVR